MSLMHFFHKVRMKIESALTNFLCQDASNYPLWESIKVSQRRVPKKQRLFKIWPFCQAPLSWQFDKCITGYEYTVEIYNIWHCTCCTLQKCIQSTLDIVNTICSTILFTILRGSLYWETNFSSYQSITSLLKRSYGHAHTFRLKEKWLHATNS